MWDEKTGLESAIQFIQQGVQGTVLDTQGSSTLTLEALHIGEMVRFPHIFLYTAHHPTPS